MKRLLLVVCALALAAGELIAAPLSGRVGFVTNRGQNPVVTETVVWLEPHSAVRVPRKAPVNLAMTTRGKMLMPHVMVVPVGSTITFPNEDPISHNLFSLSSGNQFDLGLYRAGSGKTHTFTQPGIVNVYCNVHPNMSAVIHVVTTPYYTFADPTGKFAFSDIASGRYDVLAWNEQGGTTKLAAVDVPAAGVSNLTLTLDSRGFRGAPPHANKYGKAYEPPRSREY